MRSKWSGMDVECCLYFATLVISFSRLEGLCYFAEKLWMRFDNPIDGRIFMGAANLVPLDFSLEEYDQKKETAVSER
jgi:hypothetical protein